MRAFPGKTLLDKRVGHVPAAVKQCVEDLGYGFKPTSIAGAQEAYWFVPVFFTKRDLDKTQQEFADVVLERVEPSIRCMLRDLEERKAAHELGFKVSEQVSDLSAEPGWDSSMPRYVVWLIWRGPVPGMWWPYAFRPEQFTPDDDDGYMRDYAQELNGLTLKDFKRQTGLTDGSY